MQLATKALQSEGEAAAARGEQLVCTRLLSIGVAAVEIASYYGGDACCGSRQRPGADSDCFGSTELRTDFLGADSV